jgi:hypothetical protein
MWQWTEPSLLNNPKFKFRLQFWLFKLATWLRFYNNVKKLWAGSKRKTQRTSDSGISQYTRHYHTSRANVSSCKLRRSYRITFQDTRRNSSTKFKNSVKETRTQIGKHTFNKKSLCRYISCKCVRFAISIEASSNLFAISYHVHRIEQQITDAHTFSNRMFVNSFGA